MFGRAMRVFPLDRGFGSLGDLCIASVAAIFALPATAASSALECELVSWILPRAADVQKSL